ncbi:hypothetical protein N7539_006733 [Penicillium diatomitis]|uniref:Uncharacterized protein n=1 Tax=Penicillium diatomitis TaxID=2819901 RepID=A0A9W9X1W0_9EURO|nr:uncharacterized protein N7539_006733 [Penicillium diatomitis]KAJ5480839.1 hypothetical protein N7539_006733 [Penicillium diatomitis]
MSDNVTDPPKRHWHGEAGNRYEHQNVWTHGGAKGPANRAPWALTPEQTMAADSSRRSSAASSSGSPPSTMNDRRRSSASSKSGPMFAGLQSVKRDSTDANMSARRASWNEQQQPGGFFSKLWEGYTRGK